MKFLSERNIKLHKDFLRSERLRLSIIEKSYPDIVGKSAREISRMRFDSRAEALDLICNIECHELFFSSFSEGRVPSENARMAFGSESGFLYELYECAKGCREEFLFVYSDNGRISYSPSSRLCYLGKKNAVLAIDLCEHSYFLDYGFDRDEYLKGALAFLNISKLDKFCSRSIEKSKSV